MPKIKPVYLRDIANALEKKLLSHTESTLHWVSVVGEAGYLKDPVRIWEFDDLSIHVGVTEGNSEGSLVYVHAQKGSHHPFQLEALFCIKLLTSAKRAFSEASQVYEFFESMEFHKALGHQQTVAEPQSV